MLPTLNDIMSEKSHPTEKTSARSQQLIDYAATYPDAFVRFYASDTILHIDTDTAHLVLPKAHSCLAEYVYIGNATKEKVLNGAILIECKTIKHVVASAAEAETCDAFYNAQTAVPLRAILQVMDHPQPPTPIKIDNSTTSGFVQDNIQMKGSKSWDMRFHWLRDMQTRKQFNIYWNKGFNNDSDYFTKHQSTTHHHHLLPRYIQDVAMYALNFMSFTLQWCVNPRITAPCA